MVRAIATLSLAAAERAQLDALAAELAPDLAAEQATGRDFPEVLGESSLLRFLRAAAHDVRKAADAFRESLVLRERLGANALRRRLYTPNVDELWQFERLPHASRVLVAWAEFLPTGTLDRSGDLVLCFSRQLCTSFERLVATVSRAEYLEFRVARELQMQMLLHALTERQGRLVRQTVLVDLQGISIAELILHTTSSSVKDYRGTFDTRESFVCFPETGARLFVFNAPLVVAPVFNDLVHHDARDRAEGHRALVVGRMRKRDAVVLRARRRVVVDDVHNVGVRRLEVKDEQSAWHALFQRLLEALGDARVRPVVRLAQFVYLLRAARVVPRMQLDLLVEVEDEAIAPPAKDAVEDVSLPGGGDATREDSLQLRLRPALAARRR
ncbi:hypothetical protein KFE25_006173 [Diacronema lutheri]|uniref:Uncharacterized protein n=1 Tax=Diacronema lutheri TaxID=2081491 RepID=A0A8J6CJA7_DIALT|nr:hypothetical protein KFE25_006173 [Diacronema lutheri]